MNTAIKITPRKVHFEFKQADIHWIPDDPFSSHTFNAINLLLPAGEFWFCRVFNKALPLIQDEKLKDDVQAFIRQEAIHARAHLVGQQFLKNHHFDIESGLKTAELIFGQLLSEKPFALNISKSKWLETQWLIVRVGIIAAIEHFTGIIGQWTLDNSEQWDRNHADPEMSDLFRWHLAEEVEHRNVAFDLFHHLLNHKLGFYMTRQALMAAVYPIFIYLMVDIGRSLARQDSQREMQKLGKKSVFRMLLELERVGRKTGNVPTFSFLTASVFRWISPWYHPEEEGNTEQALAYLNHSPAVLAAQA